MTNTTVQAKIQNLRTELKHSFKERDNVIDGSLAAILSGEHVALFGPPGTGKSAIVNALCQAIDGASFFQWLMTKFSTPEEVFGPISLKGLEQDQYSRVTTGKLPVAHIAFLDEIFKANSSILNSLLTIINEKKFHNNGAPQDVPLLSLFGASNELPEAECLEAMFDRFLLRYWVNYIGDRDSLRNMMFGADPSANGATLTLDEIATAKKEVLAVTFSDEMVELLLNVKAILEEKGTKVSDRRWKKMIRIIKAFAYLQGAQAVEQDHLEILIDMMWREPKEIPVLSAEIRTIINPFMAKLVQILDAAKELVANLPKESDKSAFIGAASTANAELENMVTEIEKVLAKNKNAKVQAILDEVQGLYKTVQRRAAKAMGIKISA